MTSEIPIWVAIILILFAFVGGAAVGNKAQLHASIEVAHNEARRVMRREEKLINYLEGCVKVSMVARCVEFFDSQTWPNEQNHKSR